MLARQSKPQRTQFIISKLYEKIINAITAWAHSGLKPTNGKLTAEEGANWEFEVLHKNKNQKKYGSYAVKSRQSGNMSWFERVYFDIENGQVIIKHIGHI